MRPKETYPLKAHLLDFGQITLGSLISIVCFNLFLAPSQIAPGGVSGLSLVIHHLTGFPSGLIMLALNIPILALGYFHLGKHQFLLRTAYATLIYNLGVDLSAGLFPKNLIDDPVLVALFGGVVGGISSGLYFRAGNTSAGTNVISRVLQLKTGIPLSQLYLVIDGSIIALEGFIFGWENALYAVIMLFIWGLAADYVQEGPSVVRTATIVTNRPDIVASAIMARLGVGVTAWEGRGMFTQAERSILFCTVSRPDVRILQVTIAAADPEAFVVIGHAHQRMGGSFKTDVSKGLEPLKKALKP
jgi:uncharacterized membrane-anchored protein YitT (DUF2179 family)